MRAAGSRLAAVDFRLHKLEKEDDVSEDHVVKTIDALRLAAVTGTLDPGRLGDLIEPMFEQARSVLEIADASLAIPVATYEETDDGMDVVVGYAYGGDDPGDLQIVDLPSVTAVCGVHRGPMSGISESWQGLHRWVVENHYDHAGPCREVYVRAESEDQEDWVTELQQPVRARG